MKVNHELVLRKYHQFLLKEKLPIPEEVEEGHCNGFTLVWLFARWLRAQQKTSETLKGDIEFFFTTLQLLANWDTHTNFTQQEKSNIHHLMSLIRYYQHSFKEHDIVETEFHKSFFDAEQRVLNLEYTIAGFFTQRTLTKLLTDIIYDNKLVLIFSHDHSTGFFKHAVNYFFYNSSCKQGDINADSFEKVSLKTFTANDFRLDLPAPIAIKIFSFDKVSSSYPNQHELLYKYGSLSTHHNLSASSCYNNYTPIDIAIDCHCVQSLEFCLLDLQMDPNYVLNDKTTPLLSAIYYGFNDMVATLLEYNADPNYMPAEKSPLLLAIKNGNYQAVELLLRYEADPNTLFKNSPPALHVALLKGNLKIAQLLLEFGADPGLGMQPHGETALHIAAKKGYGSIIQSLLEKGSLINDKTTTGDTALHYAYRANHTHVIRLLLQEGADPNCVNNENKKPRQLGRIHNINSSLRFVGARKRTLTNSYDNVEPAKKIKLGNYHEQAVTAPSVNVLRRSV